MQTEQPPLYLTCQPALQALYRSLWLPHADSWQNIPFITVDWTV